MRSSFLLLFLAATLCAVEEIRANVSLQGENLTPSFRNGRRLFAVGPNGDKTSPMVNGKELSDAGAQGTVSQAGSFGPLVAASSAAYFLLSQFLTFKHEGMNAHRRELSATPPKPATNKHPFLTTPTVDLPMDKLTKEIKKKAQDWTELMKEAKNEGNHLDDTAFDILYRKAQLLDDHPNEKDPHIKLLRTASLDMLKIMKKVLKAAKEIEKEIEREIARIIEREIEEMLDFMRSMRRVMTRIIKEKAIIAKERIADARAKLKHEDLVEAMKKLYDARTDIYNRIRHELSASGEAVDRWLEDAGYIYYWRINPYFEDDKRIVKEKKEVDAAEASFTSSPPRAELTKTVDELTQQAAKLVELNTEESEIDKARGIAKKAIEYTKESYSKTIHICQLVQKPLKEINPNAEDLLLGAGRDLRAVYSAINGADDVLVVLEDINGAGLLRVA